MADSKISALTALAAVPSATDLIPIVDVSDTTMAATGTNKKIAASYFVNQAGGTVYFNNSSNVTTGIFVLGNSTFDINPMPTSGTAAASFRFFRSTNTTGSKAVNFYKGDNTSTLIHTLGINSTTTFNVSSEDLDFNIRGDTDTALFYVDASTDRIGVGLSSPAYKFDVIVPAGSQNIARFGQTGVSNGFVVTSNGSIVSASMTGNLDVSGTLGSTWTGLSYFSGWTDFGGAYTSGGYKKVGDIVFLRGLVARASGVLMTIATLPSGYRPAAKEIFSAPSASGYGQVTIDSAGVITLDVGTPGSSVSLSGISFSTL